MRIPPARQVRSTLANRPGTIGVADPAIIEGPVVARCPAQCVADRLGIRHIAAREQGNDGERVVVDKCRRGDARRQARFIGAGLITADENRVGSAGKRRHRLVQAGAKTARRLRVVGCGRLRTHHCRAQCHHDGRLHRETSVRVPVGRSSSDLGSSGGDGANAGRRWAVPGRRTSASSDGVLRGVDVARAVGNPRGNEMAEPTPGDRHRRHHAVVACHRHPLADRTGRCI